MLFPGCWVMILKEICRGQNGARNENCPRPPKLAKFHQNAGCPATWETWTCEGITILKYSL